MCVGGPGFLALLGKTLLDDERAPLQFMTSFTNPNIPDIQVVGSTTKQNIVLFPYPVLQGDCGLGMRLYSVIPDGDCREFSQLVLQYNMVA